MKAIIIFMCLSLLFFSCKKKHTLKVTVTNVGTGQPMANNKVYIRELTNKVGSMGGGTVTHPFYTGTTEYKRYIRFLNTLFSRLSKIGTRVYFYSI